jgi:hypothetical protein
MNDKSLKKSTQGFASMDAGRFRTRFPPNRVIQRLPRHGGSDTGSHEENA